MDRLLRAIIIVDNDGRLALELVFEKLGEVLIGGDFKRNFTVAGLIPIGDSNLPEQSYTYPANEGGETISLVGMIKNDEAAKALLEFAKVLDGEIELDDGAIIYEVK